MRILLAFILATPIYYATDFGWTFLLIVGLQLLAGVDAEIFDRD